MTGSEAMELARDSVITLMWIAGPITIAGLLVGVAVSFIQALTQVQETTLTYMPKIIVMFLILMLALPLMADSIQSYMLRIVTRLIVGPHLT